MFIASLTGALAWWRSRRAQALLAVAIAATVANPSAVRAGSLERELLKQAPAVIRHLQSKSCKNVGVLKFRVKKGDEPISDNIGPFNRTIANRLEVALALANDNDVQKELGIVQHASDVAARIKGANHLTKEGRQVLFQHRYPLAWGKQEVTPDLFLTGLVKVSPDLREATVNILAFDKDPSVLEKVAQFTVATDPTTLFETGESFLLRGAFDDAEAVTNAGKVKNKEEKYPLQDPTKPVSLEIYYDGQPVPIEIRGGKAHVREPQEGQKVALVLKRNEQARERYAMVLMVNGENTLYKQKLPPVECRKWVLDPGDPPTTVEGYQLTGDTFERFRILSRAESKQNEMSYGADVGTISLVVFREKKGRPQLPPPPTEEAEDLAAISRGLFPTTRPMNLAALKAQLREDADRGLIVAGQVAKGKTRQVKFNADPTPVMTVTITYYRP